MTTFDIVSPADGSIVATRPFTAAAEIAAATERARRGLRAWAETSLTERRDACERFVQAMLRHREEIGTELTRQMGRPVRYTPSEIDRMAERARTMIALAGSVLADHVPDEKDGFRRFIRQEPVGVVLVVAPWNYPFLTAVNAIVPALLAGNAVLLKHSSQTALVAERFAQGFAEAGLPDGVFQVLHLTHGDTEKLIASSDIDFVCFTGSVEGGHTMVKAAAGRFIGLGLELGGKDPAYVRADADLAHAVENLVDGAFFNSGQSCCAIERIYVHDSLYERFVQDFVDLTNTYVLDDPLKAGTTLGPMVRAAAADFVRAQNAEAVAQGARALIDPVRFPRDRAGTPWLAPQVLVDVTHGMRVMREESFGPTVGIMKVASDEEAIRLMNDSPYGLTAALWTRDDDAAAALGAQLETGTVFMNRCDYLDPELAWTGVKDTGRGCTLSRFGFAQFTRLKSFHLRLPA
jgi:acyl-CoA reductase-like NAD-dependent aldehyde dehydrogenase